MLFRRVEELNLEPPNTNPSSGREENLSPGPPDYKSSALLTGPRRLFFITLIFVSQLVVKTKYIDSSIKLLLYLLTSPPSDHPW